MDKKTHSHKGKICSEIRNVTIISYTIQIEGRYGTDFKRNLVGEDEIIQKNMVVLVHFL